MSACTITLMLIAALPMADKRPQASSPGKTKTQQQPASSATSPSTQRRETNETPAIVRTLPTPLNQEQAAHEQQERENEASNKRWTMILAGLTVLVGFGQLVMIWRQVTIAHKQNTIIDGQTAIMREQAKHMGDGLAETRSSIGEATRSANAMEKVAAAMADNALSIKESLAISKAIQETQAVVSELQSRAYLIVAFLDMVNQDRERDIRFQPRLSLINRGNTPAYDVRFVARAGVLQAPLPPNVSFPDPGNFKEATGGEIGPALSKVITCVIPDMFEESDAADIRATRAQQICMWGYVSFQDAFRKARFLMFAFSFLQVGDNQWMAFDVEGKNRSD